MYLGLIAAPAFLIIPQRGFISLQPYKLKKQTNTSQRNLFPLKETFSLCILKSIISEPTQAGPSQPSITFRGEIEQPVRGLPHPPPPAGTRSPAHGWCPTQLLPSVKLRPIICFFSSLNKHLFTHQRTSETQKAPSCCSSSQRLDPRVVP